MTKLKTYLADNGISGREFAAQIGVDPSVVSRFCRRLARPSLDTALLIERATGGKVAATDWQQEPPEGLQ